MNDSPFSAQLESRRRRLGMSYHALAKRSGVSLATARRILQGDAEHASLANVMAVARVLGMDMQFTQAASTHEVRKKEAERKARRIVGLVQGTSGLESQAADEQTVQEMIDRSVYELMTGSNLRLWS